MIIGDLLVVAVGGIQLVTVGTRSQVRSHVERRASAYLVLPVGAALMPPQSHTANEHGLPVDPNVAAHFLPRQVFDPLDELVGSKRLERDGGRQRPVWLIVVEQG